MEHMLWHTREDLKRKEKELEKEAKRKEKEQRQREKQESKASKAKEVDKIAEFLCENIVPSDSVINPVSRTEMRRAFKNWKDENDQRGLLFVDMEKRLIKLFGEYPAGGWTNFQLNT
jgi:alanyl-tRNA synthetase